MASRKPLLSSRVRGFLIVALALVAALPLAQRSPAQARGQAPSDRFAAQPYMGWSSWSLMRNNPTEDAVKAQADALISTGLRDAGYVYVNLDDFSEDPHDPYDANGFAKPDLKRFPDGYAALGTYMHQHGLKFGFYLNTGITKKLYALNPKIAGTDAHIQDIADISQQGNTRGDAYRIDFSKPAAAAYLQGYARELQGWGVDFLKLDFVGPGGGRTKADNREEIRQWRLAFAGLPHPLWLELSNSMSFDEAALWRANSNGWRIDGDVECYKCPNGRLTSWGNVSKRFADAPRWAPFAGPGGWSDLDTLEIGNGDLDGLSPDERRSAFTLWAISAAPLYLGTDLTKADKGDLEILTNREVLAVDQAGVPAVPADASASLQTWVAREKDGSTVVALFNLGGAEAPAQLDLKALALPAGAAVRDLWAHKDLSAGEQKTLGALPSHGCRLFRVTPRH